MHMDKVSWNSNLHHPKISVFYINFFFRNFLRWKILIHVCSSDQHSHLGHYTGNISICGIFQVSLFLGNLRMLKWTLYSIHRVSNSHSGLNRLARFNFSYYYLNLFTYVLLVRFFHSTIVCNFEGNGHCTQFALNEAVCPDGVGDLASISAAARKLKTVSGLQA